ncbi:MAG TPA: hypothetical protein VKS60_00215 [Stellaceae bacterium]|nr:hypothetical protein [Stellaceae bacterium]
MAGSFTDYAAKAILGHVVGKAAFAMPTAYVALFTAAPSDGAAGTEMSGSGYARKVTAAADWNAASGSDPSAISNANALAFAQATANWSAITAFALMDAATAGNMLVWGYLGAFSELAFTAATSGTFTSPGHGFSPGDSVVLASEYSGTALPGGVAINTVYTVATAATDTFTLTGVTVSASGGGTVRKVATLTINNGDTPQINVGALSIKLA